MGDMIGVCPYCDAPAGVECDAHCFGRMSEYDASAYLRSFAALGLSIRRFVRRAEVEGLVADVRHETLRHDYHCNNRRSGCGCRGDRAQSALDRLAALALEGHGDG